MTNLSQFRSKKVCATAVVADHGGRFPDSREGLLTLPGIGPYTASAIAAIAYDEAATVVDGNVERVISRLFQVETPLPAAKPELTALAARLTPPNAPRRLRPSDHGPRRHDLHPALSRLRHLSVVPRLRGARAAGIQADLPRKTPKPEKPRRMGKLWLGHMDGAILLERRPEKGLLGGMLGIPGGFLGRSGRPRTAEAHSGTSAGCAHHLHPFPPCPASVRGPA